MAAVEAVELAEEALAMVVGRAMGVAMVMVVGRAPGTPSCLPSNIRRGGIRWPSRSDMACRTSWRRHSSRHTAPCKRAELQAVAAAAVVAVVMTVALGRVCCTL